VKVGESLWSAAACCRFDPASLLAASPAQPPFTGQQAVLRESGSKLPHSKAPATLSIRLLFSRQQGICFGLGPAGAL